MSCALFNCCASADDEKLSELPVNREVIEDDEDSQQPESLHGVEGIEDDEEDLLRTACERASFRARQETKTVDVQDEVVSAKSETSIEDDLPSGQANLEYFEILIERAWHVPDLAVAGTNDPYVIVEVLDKHGACIALERSSFKNDTAFPIWNEKVVLDRSENKLSDSYLSKHFKHLSRHIASRLRAKKKASTSKKIKDRQEEFSASGWDFETTQVVFTLWDKNVLKDNFAGQAAISLRDLLRRPKIKLLVEDRYGEAVVGTLKPHMPCELLVSPVVANLPRAWPRPVPHETHSPDTYPYHVFMITRGTRGDVQPFVALARGMAQRCGWLVTICTELRWKGFVKSNSKVTKGKIQFRPSGGDTEAKVSTRLGQWATKSKSEVVQMLILAHAEANFYGSATVFIHYIEALELDTKPVDMVVFGMTCASMALLISEHCKKPVVGFYLQPSIIPSEDPEWVAVESVNTHTRISVMDILEEQLFTGHSSLAKMKGMSEWNTAAGVSTIRKWFGLPPRDTFKSFKEQNIPIVIPMRDGTFNRPTDWWNNVKLTDFIFLRGGSAGSSLGEPFASFIAEARKKGGKLALMTFSSMPVKRAAMLTCAVKMLEKCTHNLHLIYVGKRTKDRVAYKLNKHTERLKAKGMFLEAEAADFGLLFQEMDCFVVHGGLGTTVEALRLKKPCMVSGPLLLDQRFWGGVCFAKGVGPEMQHIDDFPTTCVEFVNGALDPKDPFGWQANAKKQDWGDVEDDGVGRNVDIFVEFQKHFMDSLSGNPLAKVDEGLGD